VPLTLPSGDAGEGSYSWKWEAEGHENPFRIHHLRSHLIMKIDNERKRCKNCMELFDPKKGCHLCIGEIFCSEHCMTKYIERK